MSDMGDERWQVADLIIDVGSQTVTRAGTTIALPQLSFRFLMVLLHAAPRVLSSDELMEQVWTGVFVNAETVTQRAKLLRDALDDDHRKPRYFSVRRGVGYQLIPQPRRLALSENGGRRRIFQRFATSPRRRWIMAALIVVLLVTAGAVGVRYRQDRLTEALQTPLRVAVLPFDNLSSDPSDAYIARSIPEMVLNRLSTVPGLVVIARESALMGPAAIAAPNDAARQLKARFVVHGSVQRNGPSLRVTCYVIDTTSGNRPWSERFDWPVDRLYALQDRIADHVASSLESRARGVGTLPQPAGTTRNSDAYLAFLRGKSLLGRYTVAETDAAAELFEQAVKLDPDFADALVALFDARMQGADLRKDDLVSFRVRYQPLLDHALELVPDLGAAHFAKAMWSNLPQDRRAELFHRAAELDPSNSRGLTAYAEFLDNASIASKGSAGDAGKPLLDRVLSVDPLSPRARFWLVQRRWTLTSPDQIEKELANSLAIDPENYWIANRYANRRWRFNGESAEAIELMERVIASDSQNPRGAQIAFAIYLDANDPAAARAVASTTPATRDSSRVLLAQYAGNWRAAGAAALDRRGFLFNQYENWNWPEAVRDHTLHTRDYRRGAQAIATHYGFDLDDPRVLNIAQTVAAPALGHILLAKGDRQAATRLLTRTVQWIDSHPNFGMGGVRRTRAASLMLLGESGQALSDLRASIETGHDIRHWWYLIERDPVWAPVHNDPRFRAIAELCRKAAAVQRAKLDALRAAGKVPVRPTGMRS